MCEDTPHQSTAPLSTQASPPLSRIGLNDHKAGMAGLDKEKINQIIVEASRGSKFYQNEERKDQEITRRVHHIQEKLKEFTSAQKAAALKMADKMVEKLEMSRDLSRIIVHVDMDAFYAAVEMRDNPALKDCPMAVGSHSMLSTSNYVARRFGVRAAMPGFIARKLCPELVIVPPNFDKYHQASEKVKEILFQYDPTFCPMGLDESYLDLTEYVKTRVHKNNTTTLSSNEDLQSSAKDFLVDSEDVLSPLCLSMSHWFCAKQVVEEMRGEIFKKTQLTASAGVAPNKMLAKISSDLNKPNGQYMVSPTREDIIKFVQELPIRKICGIGKVTEKMLNGLGITHCHHLYQKRDILHLLFSQTSSHFFLATSLGISSADIQHSKERKSVSTERSFNEISDTKEHLAKCKELCQILAKEMEREEIAGRTITLKLKTINFEVKSHSTTLSKPVSTWEGIYDVISALIQKEIKANDHTPLRLRLMGVRVSALEKCRLTVNKQGTLAAFLKPASEPLLLDEESKPTLLDDIRLLPNLDSAETNDTEISISTCPICNLQLQLTDNISLNEHIDECLNRFAIKEAQTESELKEEAVACKKGSGSEGKRKKLHTGSESKRKKNTLLNYWKKKK